MHVLRILPVGKSWPAHSASVSHFIIINWIDSITYEFCSLMVRTSGWQLTSKSCQKLYLWLYVFKMADNIWEIFGFKRYCTKSTNSLVTCHNEKKPLTQNNFLLNFRISFDFFLIKNFQIVEELVGLVQYWCVLMHWIENTRCDRLDNFYVQLDYICVHT